MAHEPLPACPLHRAVSSPPGLSLAMPPGQPASRLFSILALWALLLFVLSLEPASSTLLSIPPPLLQVLLLTGQL